MNEEEHDITLDLLFEKSPQTEQILVYSDASVEEQHSSVRDDLHLMKSGMETEPLLLMA